jgi:hypothetical protein
MIVMAGKDRYKASKWQTNEKASIKSIEYGQMSWMRGRTQCKGWER